jgi:hypothetical protein
MRHQELHNSGAFDIVDLAEVWPASAAELEGTAEAVPDENRRPGINLLA